MPYKICFPAENPVNKRGLVQYTEHRKKRRRHYNIKDHLRVPDHRFRSDREISEQIYQSHLQNGAQRLGE